ncbi:MAG TPA: methyltransferase domain-containing protein [Nocardioidaceae bacterium]|nr:methyltransferase domain-containing protein [Nocardioidaceae bacterium]
MPELPGSPYRADWDGYFEARSERPPRPLLVEAIGLFDRPGRAVDLGAGGGVDTRVLLDRGWSVTAIDNSPDAVRRLNALAAADGRLDVRRADLADDLGLEPVDLIHAGFSLPFCRPDRFDALWHQLEAALPSGGVLAAQLFGDQDTWAGEYDDMTFHTRAEVDDLFRDWDVLSLEVADHDGSSYVGPKHWHVFHVLARRR